jgi:hypothetical protein
VLLYQRERGDLAPCRRCGGPLQEILTIAPTIKEPGAYECRRCGHKTSVLQPAHASREQ